MGWSWKNSGKTPWWDFRYLNGHPRDNKARKQYPQWLLSSFSSQCLPDHPSGQYRFLNVKTPFTFVPCQFNELMGFTHAETNTRTRTQSNKWSRTCCMGGPWLTSAISTTASFFPSQGHVDIVSNALPLLAALLSKGHNSALLWGDVTRAV